MAPTPPKNTSEEENQPEPNEGLYQASIGRAAIDPEWRKQLEQEAGLSLPEIAQAAIIALRERRAIGEVMREMKQQKNSGGENKG